MPAGISAKGLLITTGNGQRSGVGLVIVEGYYRSSFCNSRRHQGYLSTVISILPACTAWRKDPSCRGQGGAPAATSWKMVLSAGAGVQAVAPSAGPGQIPKGAEPNKKKKSGDSGWVCPGGRPGETELALMPCRSTVAGRPWFTNFYPPL